MVTIDCPLLVATVFVTANQSMGEVRLVVLHSVKAEVDEGQLSTMFLLTYWAVGVGGVAGVESGVKVM